MCVLSAFRAERAKCASSLLSEMKVLSVCPLCVKCASSVLSEPTVMPLMSCAASTTMAMLRTPAK